uniref:Movement protein n=1 Tax=Aristolochia-associated cytorhabdovirus TaxID=3071548 RepID=A0AA50LTG4_9RHAB|nr:putative movement protein [Aristolochia-associated cytorhabdovirus]
MEKVKKTEKETGRYKIELTHTQHQEIRKLRKLWEFRRFVNPYCEVLRLEIHYQPYFQVLPDSKLTVRISDKRLSELNPLRTKIEVSFPLTKEIHAYFSNFPSVSVRESTPWLLEIATNTGDLKFGTKVGQLSIIPTFLYSKKFSSNKAIKFQEIQESGTVFSYEKIRFREGNDVGSVSTRLT